MTTTATPRPLITDDQAALIGRRSESSGRVRYFINDWAQILGFEIERYNKGAIRYCRIPGVDSISNNKAERLLCGKVWIEDGQIYGRIDWDAAGVTPIPMQDAIRAEIARRQAA